MSADLSTVCRIGLLASGLGICSPLVTSADEYTFAEIESAFAGSHDGYSSDELLVREELRERFLGELEGDRALDHDQQRIALLMLLKMRKAGKLSVPTMKRGSPIDPAIHSVAEIAARVVTDRHRVTTDTMLADPRLRAEFQREANLMAPGIDAYSIGKSALTLRKRRQLRPELVLQVALWGREIRTRSLADLRVELESGRVPKRPGIYLFRNRQGYLYVGEAADLSVRLAQHVYQSDRKSLALYLANADPADISIEMHLFENDSPAAKVVVRRAYESELIRSRNPKFNVRP